MRPTPLGLNGHAAHSLPESTASALRENLVAPYAVHLRPVDSNAYTTVDLFCGAGGITEGFRRAGYSCLYGNDINFWAIETFRANHPNTTADNRPIEKVDAAALRRSLNLEPGELDVLVGGPPCQGFSINAPERFLEDPRNSLFKHYVRFLNEFRPKTLLIENVPGMLSLGGGVIFEQILQALRAHGYHVQARILFAGHYGVPQERWRMIILGSRFSPPPNHPYPTHFATARANFKGGKTMTFRLLPLEQTALLPAVTVGEAIGDLPRLGMGEGGEIVAYNRLAESEYARMMRAGAAVTFNHHAGMLAPQNAERMKFVKPGGSWRDIPHYLLPKGMQKARKSDHTKRYGRLRNDGLAGTVLTKCDPHWGAVFLPDQDRALTVREAARIQSFPDSYKFLGPRVAQYEQVGNAVPVLMAEAIARELRLSLDAQETISQNCHVA
ncbi:MAG: DNA cytosine methyltransferase [Proteobacteria bacterium]|nr:DNA cytosine methyltransferase [Pseudomonadota bacterium]